MSRRAFDQVSFIKARKAQAAADLANGDIAPLLAAITTLQGRCTALEGRCTTLEGQVTALLTHVHNYTDVDNLGVTLNKTTSIPA